MIGLVRNLGLLASLAVLANAQGQPYSQCGGEGWTGATTCVSGWTCVYSNPYYSQCLQGASTPQPTTTVAPPPPPPPTPTTTTGYFGTTTTGPSSPTTSSPSGPALACDTPATVSGYTNAALPNPFLFNNGSAVTTKAQWDCRRAQIAALIQGYEAGTLPAAPTTTGSFSGTTLSVTASTGGKSVTFTNTITYPSGTKPAGGWPLLIALDGGSIPIPSGIAVLNYNEGTIAQQTDTTSRGQGLFYQLYGTGATASAMTAWVWGVSRIIDVLEITPSANINLNAIGITGCSRDGKGALMIGAFEPRIALTIAQESGSGGDAAWRLSHFEKTSGSQVQDAVEIITENVWFSTNFGNYVNNLNVLPYDHHLLAALVAPRGLITYENTDYVWLSPLASYGGMTAAHTVYTALGVPNNHGFEQVGGHAHCAWPTSLTASLDAFFNKFMLGQTSASTAYWATNSVFNGVTWTPSQWINWSTPTLT